MIKINLLPHKKVKPIDKAVLRLWIIAIAVSVVLLLGSLGWYVVVLTGASGVQSTIDDAKVELESLSKERKLVDAYQKSSDELTRKLSVIKQVEQVKIPTSPFLNELNRVMTKDVWVDNITIKDASFTVGFASRSRDNISPFFEGMKTSTVISELVLDDTAAMKAEAVKDKKFPFTVTGKMAGYENVVRPKSAPVAAPDKKGAKKGAKKGKKKK